MHVRCHVFCSMNSLGPPLIALLCDKLLKWFGFGDLVDVNVGCASSWQQYCINIFPAQFHLNIICEVWSNSFMSPRIISVYKTKQHQELGQCKTQKAPYSFTDCWTKLHNNVLSFPYREILLLSQLLQKWLEVWELLCLLYPADTRTSLHDVFILPYDESCNEFNYNVAKTVYQGNTLRCWNDVFMKSLRPF